MVNIIWAAFVWLIIIIIIPKQRVLRLWKVGVVSLILVFIIDYTYTQLGYYQFTPHFNVFGLPLFYLIGTMGGGILMVNWIPRKPFYKVINIFFFSATLSLFEQFYLAYGAFRYLSKFTALLSFTLNIAGLSTLMLLSLAVIGEEKVYSGPKSRFNLYNRL